MRILKELNTRYASFLLHQTSNVAPDVESESLKVDTIKICISLPFDHVK